MRKSGLSVRFISPTSKLYLKHIVAAGGIVNIIFFINRLFSGIGRAAAFSSFLFRANRVDMPAVKGKHGGRNVPFRLLFSLFFCGDFYGRRVAARVIRQGKPVAVSGIYSRPIYPLSSAKR